MSALIGGVPHPGRIARPRMLGLGARGRPFAWHVSGAYPRRPLRFRLRQAAAARIACSSDPLSDDYDEGPSHSASTSDVGTGMSMFAAVSAAGGAAASGGREKGQIQQQRGGKEPGDGKNINIIDQAKQQYQKLYDRVYYGDVLPPIGPFQISYARLLQLMRARRVKRIVLLSDGRTAIVDVPVENTESNFETMKYDRRDLSITYCEEQPEWMMEKNRYYCELPGDVWEQGTFMELILENQEQRFYAPDGAVRVPYWSLLRTNEVRPELQVVDPGDALVWLNQYSGQFLPIIGLLLLRVVIAGGDWLLRKLGKERKSEQEQLAEQLGSHRAREFNVPGADGKKKGGKKQDTGVRYADVAGIDAIKGDIQEIIEILLGNQEYRAMGASPIRGVLLEGPPGTGKTLLAKAMAGEAGIPFFSANGAEFVEMFQGVAAARIRSLFRAARKNAPAIIFIDEIDAIGKARSDGPTDPGTQEREQGLLQLLAEMDGFVRDDQVLVIGATNRATALDEALLRPGRFDRSIYMGRPSPSNRLKVLQVHARNKPISHDNDDALLRTVADLTIGYSGAELANLLNEAAILAVRKDQKEIDLAVLKEAMDKVRLGLPHTSLPDTPAKRRYATIEAARAVAFAVTPGLPPIEHVTIRPRGNTVARVLFVPQEFRSDGGAWQKLGWGRQQSNAVQLDKPLTQFELACGLMVPLYAARACEEVLYGKEGVSLTTSKEVSRAAELARWIVVDSKLHPVNRESPVLSNMAMGGYEDPTTMWMDGQHDEEIMALQRAAYERATRLVEERRPVIEAVGRELCENSDETVLGTRLVELLKATPLAPSPMAEAFAAAAAAVAANGATSAPQEGEDREQPAGEAAPAAANGNGATGATSTAGRRAAAEVLGDSVLQDSQLQQLAEVVMGRIENFDLLPKNLARTKAQQVREQLLDEETRRRLESIQEFIAATDNSLKPSNGTGFPAPPAVPEDKGEALDAWTPKQIDVIEV